MGLTWQIGANSYNISSGRCILHTTGLVVGTYRFLNGTVKQNVTAGTILKDYQSFIGIIDLTDATPLLAANAISNAQ